MSGLPEYCQVMRVKGTNGEIKELVFPKALDLDRPKRPRTTFTTSQLQQLEAEFEKNPYLVGEERTKLANTLKLSDTQVKVWFQNRRTKCKRKNTANSPDTSSSSGSESTSSSPFQSTASSMPPTVLQSWPEYPSPFPYFQPFPVGSYDLLQPNQNGRKTRVNHHPATNEIMFVSGKPKPKPGPSRNDRVVVQVSSKPVIVTLSDDEVPPKPTKLRMQQDIDREKAEKMNGKPTKKRTRKRKIQHADDDDMSDEDSEEMKEKIEEMERRQALIYKRADLRFQRDAIKAQIAEVQRRLREMSPIPNDNEE